MNYVIASGRTEQDGQSSKNADWVELHDSPNTNRCDLRHSPNSHVRTMFSACVVARRFAASRPW